MKNKLLLTTLTLLILFSCKKSNLNKDFCDCADSPTTQVIDTTTLTIPNIITPNDDGYNDKWEIKNINYFPDCYVKIIREGLFHKTVFESTGYSNNWDGEGKAQKYKYEITIGATKITGHVCVVAGVNDKFDPSDYDCLQGCTAQYSNDPLIGL
jgi:gliding motility-associated-like protein